MMKSINVLESGSHIYTVLRMCDFEVSHCLLCNKYCGMNVAWIYCLGYGMPSGRMEE